MFTNFLKIKTNKEVNLRDFDKKRINLLPDYVKEKRRKQSFIIFIVLIIGVSLIGTGLYYFSIKNEIENVVEENKKLESELDLFYKTQENQALLESLMKWIEFKTSLLQNVENKYLSMNMLAGKIESSIPESVEFFSIDMVASESINISAQCDDQKSIAFAINELKRVDIFEKVYVGSISKIDFYDDLLSTYIPKYRFNIIIELRGVNHEE